MNVNKVCRYQNHNLLITMMMVTANTKCVHFLYNLSSHRLKCSRKNTIRFVIAVYVTHFTCFSTGVSKSQTSKKIVITHSDPYSQQFQNIPILHCPSNLHAIYPHYSLSGRPLNNSYEHFNHNYLFIYFDATNSSTITIYLI